MALAIQRYHGESKIIKWHFILLGTLTNSQGMNCFILQTISLTVYFSYLSMQQLDRFKVLFHLLSLVSFAKSRCISPREANFIRFASVVKSANFAAHLPIKFLRLGLTASNVLLLECQHLRVQSTHSNV